MSVNRFYAHEVCQQALNSFRIFDLDIFGMLRSFGFHDNVLLCFHICF